MPEADGDPVTGRNHCSLGVDEALCHLVQAQVPRRKAEEMTGLQRP
jgi:hypothetical protein